jgi:hypothetical protein
MKRLIVKGIITAMLVAALVFPPVASAFASSDPKIPTTPCEQTNAMLTSAVNVSSCIPMHTDPFHMMNNMMNNMMGNMMGMR